MTTQKLLGIAGVTALALSCGGTLQAGEITAFTWSSGIASVAGVTIVTPPDPNNDDVIGGSLNELWVTQKDYTGIGPVDIEFTVVPTGGVTEYVIIEGVSNSTGLDFGQYRSSWGLAWVRISSCLRRAMGSTLMRRISIRLPRSHPSSLASPTLRKTKYSRPAACFLTGPSPSRISYSQSMCPTASVSSRSGSSPRPSPSRRRCRCWRSSALAQ